MQPVLNVEDIKRVEIALTRVGVSVSELMHRAGYAAAQEALGMGGDISNVVILVGLGNNGGDGWVAAEALRSRNCNVKVVTPLEPDQISGDLARHMAQRAVRAGASTARFVLHLIFGLSASISLVLAYFPLTFQVAFLRRRAR